jgi:hypothetical protein
MPRKIYHETAIEVLPDLHDLDSDISINGAVAVNQGHDSIDFVVYDDTEPATWTFFVNSEQKTVHARNFTVGESGLHFAEDGLSLTSKLTLSLAATFTVTTSGAYQQVMFDHVIQDYVSNFIPGFGSFYTMTSAWYDATVTLNIQVEDPVPGFPPFHPADLLTICLTTNLLDPEAGAVATLDSSCTYQKRLVLTLTGTPYLTGGDQLAVFAKNSLGTPVSIIAGVGRSSFNVIRAI